MWCAGTHENNVLKWRANIYCSGFLYVNVLCKSLVKCAPDSSVPPGTEGPGLVAQLSARAQHHATCVGKLDGHVARHTDSSNHRERYSVLQT